MKSLASISRTSAWATPKYGIRLLGPVVALLLFCLPGFAQLNLGSIHGAITDQTGGAIVGATVNVVDVARGTSRPLISDSAGEYSAPSLTPGTYTVHVESMGFRTVDREDILVQVGQTVRVDVTLQPGQQTQTITVTGELPMIDTSSAQLTGMLENISVEELPVNGRNYQYLLGTRPGVVWHPTGDGNAFTADGAPADDQAWMFDGLYDTNIFSSGASIVGGANLGTDAPTILPLDAIQEVDLVESPKAEFGWKMGAHINVGLKAGTNGLHGTAYAFGRDGNLNAKNPFLLSSEPKAPLSMEQFGATVGGPIKKNKIFYFLGYEGQRFTVGVPRLATEPTTADLPGSGAATGNSIPDALYDILQNHQTVTPSALSLNLAGCQALTNSVGGVTSGNFTPAQVATLRTMSAAQLASHCSSSASLFGNGGTATTEVTDFNTLGGSDNGILKIDWHPNDHNSINGEAFNGQGPQTLAGTAVQPYWVGGIYTRGTVARGVWIWTPNSAWVNDFRYGFDEFELPVYDYECQHPTILSTFTNLGFVSGNIPCNPANPVFGGFPQITVSGFGALGDTEGITQDQSMHYHAINDSVSYTRGRHIFKFGGEMRFQFMEGEGSGDTRGIMGFGGTNAFPTGTGTATALEDFMAGVPATGAIVVGNPANTFHFNGYAGFVQDDWRVTSRISLNLGLRYEYTGSIWENNHLMGNFIPNDTAAGPTSLIQQTSGHNVYAPDPHDFAPRIGLAWDVTGKGTTVVSVGFSSIYSTMLNMKQLVSSAGAYLNGIPTGYTFYNPNGTTFAGPGNIKSNIESLVTAQLPWAVGQPVYQAASPAGLLCGNGLLPTPGAAPNPAPCQIQAANTKIGQSQMFYRNLGVQHAFTNNLSINIAYVGDHGTNLLGTTQINSPTPGVKNGAGTVANPAPSYMEQARRPFNTEYPFYGVIEYESAYQDSNYDSLQVTLNQRVTRGLNFTAGYTYSHDLDDSAIPLQPNHPQLEYGNSSTNSPNEITFTATYNLPGRKSPGQMLEGWQVNTAVTLLAGFPVNADDTTNDISGTGQLNDRWTLVGNSHDFKIGGPGATPCWGVTGSSFSKAANCTTVATVTNMPALCQSAAAAEAVNPSLPVGTANATGTTALAAYGCYMMGATVMVPPAQGTFGTMARDELNSKDFRNWDFSATKNWKFRERYGLQFRAEFFNILNRTQYTPPLVNLAAPTTFGQSQSTTDSGNPVIGSGPRKVQFGLKISF